MSVSATAVRGHSMSPALIVLLLSLLLGLQPITTDLYLPALPALTDALGAPMAQAQLTLSGLLLSFGLSQMVWGPVSDRVGRRPVLLWGLGLYVLASVATVFAPGIELLIAARVVQGAALGAAVMCARAIVRDLYTPVDAARAMSRALTGLGVIACASAPLGSVLAEWAGWRYTLAALAVCGALILALIAWQFEETVTRLNPRALQPGPLLNNWLTIARHPTFRAWSALSAASYGGLFTLLATSSFVLIRLHGLSRPLYGLFMFSLSLTYIGSTFACRRMLARWGARRAVGVAAGFTLAAGLLLLLATLSGLATSNSDIGMWSLILPCQIYMLGHGVHQPCSQSGAVSPFPRMAGAASALNGFVMALAAFVMGSVLAMVFDGTARPMALGMAAWAGLIALVSWTLVRRHGDAH